MAHSKKYTFFIILFLVLFFQKFYGQYKKSDLKGLWVKVYEEMKDGSSIIPTYPEYVEYLEINFDNKILSKNKYPAHNNHLVDYDYSLIENLIILNINYSYEIESLKADSLIISQKIPFKNNEELRRYYLVSKEILTENDRLKHIGVSHLNATKYFTPKFKSNISLYLNSSIMNISENIKLKGRINILVNTKMVSTEIYYSDFKNSYLEYAVIEVLNNSFNQWDLRGFKQFTTISIDFVLESFSRDLSSGIRIELLTNSFDQMNGRYGLSYQQIFKGKELFENGLAALKKLQYEKAIQFFTEAYELNHTLIDALYNRAYCYSNLGDLEKACRDWQLLHDLNQTEGKSLYLTYCSTLDDN